MAPLLATGAANHSSAAARHWALVRANDGATRSRRAGHRGHRYRKAPPRLGEDGSVCRSPPRVTRSSKATAQTTSELSTASRRPLLPRDSQVKASTSSSGCSGEDQADRATDQGVEGRAE